MIVVAIGLLCYQLFLILKHELDEYIRRKKEQAAFEVAMTSAAATGVAVAAAVTIPLLGFELFNNRKNR